MLAIRSIASKRAVMSSRLQQTLIRRKSAVSKTPTTASSASTSGATKSGASTAASSTTTTTTSASEKVPVAQCLLAAGLGVSTVSAVAAIIENATASSVPAFDPKGQRYDASTFKGRFSRMLLACDPRLLMYTQEQIQRSQEMVQNCEQYADGTPEMDRTLWEAKRIVDGALHPDTGDAIPHPFRMSGYVFFNGPVCVAMVASQSTLPLLFWAWVNQSQNALVNYFNRNASSPMTNETLVKSYAAAVGSALCVSFGLATIIQKRFDAQKAKSLLRWVAFPSSVAASSLNCYIVRSPEIDSGIPLLDANGNDVLPGETSQVAATRGVNSTTLSRAILQAPVFFVPPLLVSSGPFKRLLTKHPIMTVPLTTYLLLVSFGCGLPATVAIFPQISEIHANDVEDKFQHLRHPKTNQAYNAFYYNKGL